MNSTLRAALVALLGMAPSASLVLTPTPALADPEVEVVYVNPAKAPLKSEPRMDASVVQEVTRGTPLTVIKKEGVWIQVTHSGTPKSGWISKLFISSNKPVGGAELNSLAADKSLSKASRRRSSSYNVSASTRGLTAGKRGREGRETYQSDPEAVEKMEKSAPSETEVNQFKKSGKLPE